ELGRGGQGFVYRAVDPALGRPVALKVLVEPASAGAEEGARFEREARAVAKLRHPGIVAVHGTGVHEGKPYIVLELVEGESLEAILAREGRLQPRRAAELVRKIALALEHAHEAGVLHRDIEPGNVLVDRAGEPRLTDFGLARQEAFSGKLTATGDVLGKPAFMAPEQAAGTPEKLDRRTDVYALGGLLCRTLAGRPPFEGANVRALLDAVSTKDPKPLREVAPHVHVDLETIALRCLAKERDGRYPTASAVAEELRRFLEGEPIV